MKRQRNRMFAVVFQILVLTFFCARCFAVRDPIGDPTVPPTSARSGLVKRPVSTKVAGFQGFVPYRTTLQFADPATADSRLYIGRSAAVTSTKMQSTPQPYYLPHGAMGSAPAAGEGSMLSYSNIRSNKVTDESVIDKLLTAEQQTIMPTVSPLYDYDRTRPLSYEPTDLERVITYDQIREKNKEDLSDALQKASRGMHKIGDEEKSSLHPAEQEKERLGQSTNLISESAKPMERLEPVEPFQPVQQPAAETEKTAVESVYEQMLQEIAGAEQQQEVQPEQQREIFGLEREQEPEEKKPGDLRSELSDIQKETAEAVIGIHKSFATEAEDKFNYYMRIAEKFLAEGKYYRATDAYTLASIYKPQDPLAYAGRSHALFASGEYMSSAYFLAGAIDIFPQYVNFKIDLNAMIPDKDRLESRIVDIKQWINRTDSAQLSFLLAYIYYQLDKPDLAAEAIQFAQKEMPDNAAVKALKQVIEKKR